MCAVPGGAWAPPGRACSQRPGYTQWGILNLPFPSPFQRYSAASKKASLPEPGFLLAERVCYLGLMFPANLPPLCVARVGCRRGFAAARSIAAHGSAAKMCAVPGGGQPFPIGACSQRPGYVTCRTLNLPFSSHFTNASAGSKRPNWRSLAFAACAGFSIFIFLSKIFTGMACSHCWALPFYSS